MLKTLITEFYPKLKLLSTFKSFNFKDVFFT